ncbi:endonuclease MutS2 [Chloroflexota bacterium]
MDDKSLEILEFFEIKKIVAGYSSFSVARELILSQMPLTDFEEISLLLGQYEEACYLLSLDSTFVLGGASDIREAARMASLGRILEPMTLIEAQQTLAIMRQARGSLLRISRDIPLLWDAAKDISELPNVEKEITQCLSPNGDVLNRASKALTGIRTRLKRAHQTLRERLESIIRTPKGQRIVQEALITEREGRYVIPIKNEFRKEIEGITHDVSNTGATVFVEPWATIELGNNIRELVTEERREVERILRDLSISVGNKEAEISLSVEAFAVLDIALAKAKYARALNASKPELTTFSDTTDKDDSKAFIKLVEARHPLLGKNAVPLTVDIGQDFSILVVTGPNTGGKTVALKTIGLMSMMAQSGIPIPALPNTCLPIFDNIFADIGDEQSIEQTLSSFSWHMGNMVRILENATGRSLVLLDELGTSTDPGEGSALARSILLHFLSKKILTVATTHFGDLKAFAHTTPGLQNASFDFDPDTLAPTYNMTLGIPGGSNALATASRLGIPQGIIDEARKLLPRGALDLDATIADIMAEKQRIQEAREVLEKESNKAKAQNVELEVRLHQLSEDEKRTIQEARDTVVREAADLHKQIRQANTELRKKKTSETINMAKNTLKEMQSRLKSEAWTPKLQETEDNQQISVGDTVYLNEINQQGVVLSIFEKTQEVEVQIGQIKLKTGMNGIEKMPGGVTAKPEKAASIVTPPSGAVSSRLDLRGKRADEVEVEVDRYLNDASLTNMNEVLIIHGYGTGTVRQIVRDFVTSHPLAKSFRPGAQSEGGDGVTVVSL